MSSYAPCYPSLSSMSSNGPCYPSLSSRFKLTRRYFGAFHMKTIYCMYYYMHHTIPNEKIGISLHCHINWRQVQEFGTKIRERIIDASLHSDWCGHMVHIMRTSLSTFHIAIFHLNMSDVAIFHIVTLHVAIFHVDSFHMIASFIWIFSSCCRSVWNLLLRFY